MLGIEFEALMSLAWRLLSWWSLCPLSPSASACTKLFLAFLFVKCASFRFLSANVYSRSDEQNHVEVKATLRLHSGPSASRALPCHVCRSLTPCCSHVAIFSPIPSIAGISHRLLWSGRPCLSAFARTFSCRGRSTRSLATFASLLLACSPLSLTRVSLHTILSALSLVLVCFALFPSSIVVVWLVMVAFSKAF